MEGKGCLSTCLRCADDELRCQRLQEIKCFGAKLPTSLKTHVHVLGTCRNQGVETSLWQQSGGTRALTFLLDKGAADSKLRAASSGPSLQGTPSGWTQRTLANSSNREAGSSALLASRSEGCAVPAQQDSPTSSFDSFDRSGGPAQAVPLEVDLVEYGQLQAHSQAGLADRGLCLERWPRRTGAMPCTGLASVHEVEASDRLERYLEQSLQVRGWHGKVMN